MEGGINPFPMLAAYNGWANGRLYGAAAELSDVQYRADRGAFFKSVEGTLNHLLVADRVWMCRFTGSGHAPDRLDAILFDRIYALRAAREAEDDRIAAYAAGLTQDDLVRVFTYTRVSAPQEEVTQSLAPALIHFFNHQTHHRGQAHALLTGLVGKAPALDLAFFQRQSGMSC